MRIEEITKEKLLDVGDNDLYQLRLRSKQFFEKYSRFEKENLFIDVNWKDFFEKYSILMREFVSRVLKFNKWEMDSTLNLRLSNGEDFQIKVLGTMAQTYSSLGNHFSLLISRNGKNVLIDPAVHRSQAGDGINGIIITQADKDHWTFIKEYDKIPVYSMGTILDALPPNDFHPILKPLSFDGLTMRPIKTIHKVETSSMGVRVDFGEVKVSILPEFMSLTKAAKDLIVKTVWIVGVGNFLKDDARAGKLSFKSLLKLADELKPKVIYLTNLRKDILKHEEEVSLELKKYGGRILKEGNILKISDIQKIAWKLTKPSYEISEIDDLKDTPYFNKGQAVVEAEFAGVRAKIEKKGDSINIFTDPEDTENPDVTDWLSVQVDELKKMKGNFVGDSVIAIVKDNEVSAVKFDSKELCMDACVYVFDILEYNGKDITFQPLAKRKELLNKFKDMKHVHFVRTTSDLTLDALSYEVDLGKPSDVKKVMNKIMGFSNKGISFPKCIAGGIIIKLLDTPYEEPQSHSMLKWDACSGDG